MKTVTHLLAKDLRRYWPLALLVLVACAIAAIHDYFGIPLARDRTVQDILPELLLWPLVFLFVVAVVQEDAVVGDKAFWLTRPIRPGALLSAKLLLILIGAVVPYVLTDWLFAQAIGASHLVAAGIAVESSGLILMVTLAAALVGALTRSVLHACAWVGVGFIAFMVMIGLVGDNFSRWFAFLPATTPSADRLIVLSTLTIIGSFTLLQWHYRRRSGLTLVGMGAVALLTLVIANNFPLSLIGKPEPAPVRPLPKTTIPEGFSITALDNTANGGGLSRSRIPGADGRRELLTSAALGIRLTQSSVNYLTTAFRFTSTLTFSDGKVFNGEPTTFYQRANEATLSRWMQAQLGFPNNDSISRDSYVGIISIPEAHQLRAASPGNTLRTQFALTESTCERETTLPLRRGVSVGLAEGRVILRKASTDHRYPDPGVQLDLRILKPLTIFAPQADQRPDGSGTGWQPLGNRMLVLYRRATNEFSIGTLGGNFSSSSGFRHSLTTTYRFTHRLGPGMAKPTAGLPPEWLADAELWILRTEPVSEFTYPMTVENFRVIPRTRLDASDWRHADNSR